MWIQHTNSFSAILHSSHHDVKLYDLITDIIVTLNFLFKNILFLML